MSPKNAKAAPAQKLYRSISEVSALLEIKPHVLRYWETQFPTLRPRKNRAGNRMYRPEEVDLLGRIKELLYAKRFTIEGARRLLAEEKRAGGRSGRNGSAPTIAGNGHPVSVSSPRRDDPVPAAEGTAAVLAALRVAEESLRSAEARDRARTDLLRETKEALRALSREIRGGSEEAESKESATAFEASSAVDPLEIPVGAGAGMGS